GGQRRRTAALPPPRVSRPRYPAWLLRARAGRHRDGAATRSRPMSGVDLAATIGTVRLPTPVIAASGTFGYGTEFDGLASLDAVGAIRVTGRSLAPYAGKPAPRLVETAAGMLNAIGLQNIGVDAFLRERLPRLREAGARIVANFWGDSAEDFAACAARL